MDTIQRYELVEHTRGMDVYQTMERDEYGEYVKFEDHEKAIKFLKWIFRSYIGNAYEEGWRDAVHLLSDENYANMNIAKRASTAFAEMQRINKEIQ